MLKSNIIFINYILNTKSFIVFKISNGPPKKINLVDFLVSLSPVLNTTEREINSFEILYPITHKI